MPHAQGDPGDVVLDSLSLWEGYSVKTKLVHFNRVLRHLG